MQAPADLQVIGTELAIRWPDGEESYLPLEELRKRCPCAACCGEPGLTRHIPGTGDKWR
ncbi:MAG: gamma-butyrobetaine hydroxylase-like domain-containing protein, partial [Candidatus Methylacidiphilales bacterium]